MGRSGDDESLGGTSPCLLHTLDGDGRPIGDEQQRRDVDRWRKSERERLLAVRQALTPDYRAAETTTIEAALDALLPGTRRIVSVYWPIRGEPDLRGWMKRRVLAGLGVALPVATALGAPMTFRLWTPEGRVERGLWRIPYPADGAEVVPDAVIAPLVGYDPSCFRLGYGGGFFDRTLAGYASKPLVIGVGYRECAIATVYPQPHDIPMDHIVPGSGAPLARV